MDKCSAVWRERMLHKFTSVFLIDKSGLVKSSRMFADGFSVGFQHLYDSFQGCAVMLRDKKQHRNAIMVRDPLEMPLHLFCRLHFSHTSTIHNIPTFSSL